MTVVITLISAVFIQNKIYTSEVDPLFLPCQLLPQQPLDLKSMLSYKHQVTESMFLSPILFTRKTITQVGRPNCIFYCPSSQKLTSFMLNHSDFCLWGNLSEDYFVYTFLSNIKIHLQNNTEFRRKFVYDRACHFKLRGPSTHFLFGFLINSPPLFGVWVQENPDAPLAILGYQSQGPQMWCWVPGPCWWATRATSSHA